MVANKEYGNTHLLWQAEMCIVYLLIIKIIIKAIAIIDTATSAEKSKMINCNNISTICTTSLSMYMRWQPHSAFPKLLY